MTRVKICGIRRKIDVEYANMHLPDYVGFVFAESRRRVSVPVAMELAEALNTRIEKAGVFVNETVENVVEMAGCCNLGVIQLHGDESPEFVNELKDRLKSRVNRNFSRKPPEIWKAIRVKVQDCIKEMRNYEADAFLLDTYVEGSHGGAGVAFDWTLAAEAGKYGKIILAGGLNLHNINEAIEMVRPYAVDVSSGVETEGFKDENKVKRFIYSVRYNQY